MDRVREASPEEYRAALIIEKMMAKLQLLLRDEVIVISFPLHRLPIQILSPDLQVCLQHETPAEAEHIDTSKAVVTLKPALRFVLDQTTLVEYSIDQCRSPVDGALSPKDVAQMLWNAIPEKEKSELWKIILHIFIDMQTNCLTQRLASPPSIDATQEDARHNFQYVISASIPRVETAPEAAERIRRWNADNRSIRLHIELCQAVLKELEADNVQFEIEQTGSLRAVPMK